MNNVTIKFTKKDNTKTSFAKLMDELDGSTLDGTNLFVMDVLIDEGTRVRGAYEYEVDVILTGTGKALKKHFKKWTNRGATITIK